MKYKFSEEQYEAIKKARKQNRDKQIDKRLQVLELRCEGKGLDEIASITEFHRSHVSNLIRKYFEEGLQAVSEKHYLGNRRNMSIEEEAQFLEQFREKAEEGQVLDIHEIRAAYEKEAGHSIGCAQVYRVLHRHGWRKVMPRSKHPKRASEEVIETSKKLTPKSNG
jgi:transposase